MTDTDDTDDLLLIPPDFFTVKSDSEQSNIDPYYSVVDSLIDQVSNLQTRIKSIESSDSFLTNSPNNSYSQKARMQKHIKQFRKYNSSDDIYIPSSTQSTPQRPHSKFKMNSLPGTPYVDKFNHHRNVLELSSLSPSSIRSKHSASHSVSRGDNSTINEVDTFLSKVKTIQRFKAVRNLENEFNFNEPNQEITMDSPKKQQSEIVRDKSKSQMPEAPVLKEQDAPCGNNKDSVPDYDLGIRNQLYKCQQENELSHKEKITHFQTDNEKDFSNDYPHLSSFTNQTLTDRYTNSESSTSESFSHITTLKNYSKHELLTDPIHTNALNILNMHKQLTEKSTRKSSKIHEDNRPKKPNNSTVDDNLGLLSLADIWNATSSQMLHLNPSQIIQKFQEEKLRRQVTTTQIFFFVATVSW